ncbi:MAG: hypothetical protein K6F00_11750 [Lachnospiraceae bacterium]|nr:hypothetical protein [Lachnospiraceae bacterium]
MTILEIGLLALGAIFFIGSFFMSEKLSSSDVDEIKKMSEREVRILLEQQLKNADSEIKKKINDKVDESFAELERKSDREVNEKIMAIAEYSDNVINKMDKAHEEIMFMYDMLNEKQEKITQITKDAQNYESHLRGMTEEVSNLVETQNSGYDNQQSDAAYSYSTDASNEQYYNEAVAYGDQYYTQAPTQYYTEADVNGGEYYPESATGDLQYYGDTETSQNEAAMQDEAYSMPPIEDQIAVNEALAQITEVNEAENVSDLKPAKNKKSKTKAKQDVVPEEAIVPEPEPAPEPLPPAPINLNLARETEDNNNERIISMHKQGYTQVEIAKKTGVGLGEIQLILGLYGGEEE